MWFKFASPMAPAMSLCAAAFAYVLSTAVSAQPFTITNPHGPAVGCTQTSTGTYCPNGGGGGGGNDYDDDGAPCRGGWMHGRMWDEPPDCACPDVPTDAAIAAAREKRGYRVYSRAVDRALRPTDYLDFKLAPSEDIVQAGCSNDPTEAALRTTGHRPHHPTISILKKPVRRPRQAQILTQRRTFVFAAE
jgi:hypothetical protein